jgi:hypothetical protein
MQNDSDPVIAAVFQNELDAHVAAASLIEHGIDVRVTGSLTANSAVEVPGATQLLVPRSQLKEACTLLATRRE